MVLFLIVILTPLSYYLGEPLREPSDPRKSDAIVLFSSGQIDGTWLTPDATQRTVGALLLYRSGLAPVIVTSGSQHALGLRQAEIEAEWLERAGVPRDALVVENRSGRTYTSVLEVRRLMAERGWRSALIVTSDLDIPRIRLICRRLEMNVSFLGVPLEPPPRPYRLLYATSGLPVFHHALYEYAALAFYKLRGWI